jgi:hypothetical protein
MHILAGCKVLLNIGHYSRRHDRVQSTARLTIHLQLDIGANALVIRAVQSPKCIV